MRTVALLLTALVFLSSSSLGQPAYLPALGRFVILVHDVSPAYQSQLEEITQVINSLGLQDDTYLFIIPNHGGRMEMWKYSEFCGFLRKLRDEGYHVELHGYNHIGEEFDCNSETAMEKLCLGLTAFEKCGFSRPEYFIAPRYALSKDALGVLLKNNLTVIGENFIYLPNGTVKPILNREYTWYIPTFLLPYQLASAEETFKNTKGTLFLSIHPRAVNNLAGMEFLRRFLTFVRENERASANPLVLTGQRG
jgi:predicted deacetylase